MRKFIFFLCAAFALTSFHANAQTLKFGHINTADIWEALAEKDSVQSKMDAYRKELEAILGEVAAEYDKKTSEFQANQEKWSEPVKESKQNEILDLYKRMQTQQQNAQQRMQTYQNKLLEPIQKKIKDAVDKVAKANSFTYIFDISVGSPIYVSETQSTDIGALVKKELGVTK